MTLDELKRSIADGIVKATDSGAWCPCRRSPFDPHDAGGTRCPVRLDANRAADEIMPMIGRYMNEMAPLLAFTIEDAEESQRAALGGMTAVGALAGRSDKLERVSHALRKVAGWNGTDISDLIEDGLIEEGDL